MVIRGRLDDRWLRPAATRRCAELRVDGSRSGVYGMIGGRRISWRVAWCIAWRCVARGAADRGGCRVVHGSRRTGVGGVGAVVIRVDVAVWVACVAGIACVTGVPVVVWIPVVVRVDVVVRIASVATVVGGTIVIEIGIAVVCRVAAIGGRCTGIGVGTGIIARPWIVTVRIDRTDLVEWLDAGGSRRG